jgi:hypothetical protein
MNHNCHSSDGLKSTWPMLGNGERQNCIIHAAAACSTRHLDTSSPWDDYVPAVFWQRKHCVIDIDLTSVLRCVAGWWCVMAPQ